MKKQITAALATGALAISMAATATVATPQAAMPQAHASGTNNQYQHVLRYGDTGTDVRALQYMLRSRGQSISVDGKFGPATRDAVTAYQRKKGLTVDGLVGPNTWTSVHVTTSASKGGVNDIKALQYLLRSKFDSSIVVDGLYGPRTTAAVKRFQAFVGHSQRSYVNDADWSRLLGAFEKPNSSWCDYRGGEGYNWGTSTAVGAMEEVGSAWDTSRYGKPSYGRLSRRTGGYLSPHSTHRVGLDVDVAAFNTAKSQCYTTVTYYASSYNRAATRLFIQRIRATGQVKQILFNDPTLIREGLTVPASGHDDHLHVRFYETGFRDSGSGTSYDY